MNVNILFPVFNERLRLEKGIETTYVYMKQLRKVPFRLTILDNGSTDETPALARALCEKYSEVHYVRVEEQGVGAAFRKGIELNESEIVGYMDIDLSTDLSCLRRALSLFARRPDLQYINGSRFHRRSRTTGRKWYRRMTSAGLLLLLKLFLQMKATDALCGFTFLHRAVAEELVAQSGNENGWFYTVEFLLRAERTGVRILELPVHWEDDPNTTVRLWKTIRNYCIQIARLYRVFQKEGNGRYAKKD